MRFCFIPFATFGFKVGALDKGTEPHRAGSAGDEAIEDCRVTVVLREQFSGIGAYVASTDRAQNIIHKLHPSNSDAPKTSLT